jgi:hypothetical protein
MSYLSYVDAHRVRGSLDAVAAPMLAPGGLRSRVLGPAYREVGRGGSTSRRRPRRHRARPVPLAARIAIVAAFALASALVPDLGSSARETGAFPQVVSSVHGAHAALLTLGEGTELVVSGMPQPPAGEVYEVWLQRAGARPLPTNELFGVSAAGRASVDVTADLRETREVIVTSEPRGGSRRPTGPPLLRVLLPARR